MFLKSEFSVILLLGLFIVQSKAGPEQCPNLIAQANFDGTKFQGHWFRDQHYSSFVSPFTQQCLSMNVTFNSTGLSIALLKPSNENVKETFQVVTATPADAQSKSAKFKFQLKFSICEFL